MTTATDTLALSDYLAAVREQSPDEVLTIDRELDLDCGLTSLFVQLESRNQFPIIVAERPVFAGRRLDFPVVTGQYSSRLRLAQLLEVGENEVGAEYAARLSSPVAPTVVDAADAPVKSTVLREDEVDLRCLPAPRHHPMDPGQYLSAGFLTTYNRTTGVENSSIQRGWIRGPRELRVFMDRPTHNYRNFQEYEAANEPMPAAYWVGHHPLHVMGCQTRGRLEHWEAAGAIAKRSLRLTPSASLGDDFLVPADAEFVIEGYILPHERRPEGPFGEYTMYYGPQHHNPVMEITAITHRAAPVWDAIMVGHTHWLSAFQREGNTLANVRRAVPQVKNVYLPRRSGCGNFHVYIQIADCGPGQAQAALLAALSSDPLVKHAFAFDDDVNIFDDREVLWALATRFQADTDILFVPGIIGPGLDPSGRGRSVGCKAGFDCTRDAPRDEFAARLAIPDEYQQTFAIEDYVGAGALERLREDTLV